MCIRDRLKEYRGQIDLIYIDPPFDSKADYKKKIEIRGIGSRQPFHAGKGQTAERQKIHQPVMVLAPGTIQKLRGNAGHVMGPVGTVWRIRCAQLPQYSFRLCLDVRCRQGLAHLFHTDQIYKPIQHGGMAVYGDVYKRQQQDPSFAINVEALNAAQPKDLDASEIEVRLEIGRAHV